jgi:putative ABC transport system substrate-binding protein
MKEVVPGVRKAIVLVNRNNPLHESIWKESRSAAHALNVDLEALRVGAPDELEGAFATATRRPAGVMMVPLDPMFNGQRRRLVALAAKHALPTMYGDRLYAEAGGLIAYGPSYSDLFRRAATYVDKILRGAKPRDLPVEQPTTFEMVINLKTAKALGLTIPPSLLLRADAIIQ